MMKKITVTAAAIMVVLLFGNLTQGGVSLVMNGSFENDGEIPDITVESPQYWCDVNVPTDKFGGWVSTDWSTHGYDDGDGNSLTFYSYDTATFEAGDMAAVSQQVYLEDVNQIIFDIKLSTDWWPDIQWNPDKFSAVVLIDGNVVWDSNSCVPDENGECRDVEVGIDINDANLHTLSLAMRANVVQQMPSYIFYFAQWDFVKFDTHCGGFGYLPQDLNHDCYVDTLDLAILAEQWLVEDPNYEYDLFVDDENTVNFRDFAVLANSWLDYRDWRDWQGPNFIELELVQSDLNNDGIVDYGDVSVMAGDWLSEGDCIRADLYNDGIVNFSDFAILADEWLMRSWLYGVEQD